MENIKCPHCGEIFTIDESGYAAIVSQIKDKEFGPAFETAHALKGMYSNLSLDPLTKPVSEITELLRSNSDADYSPLIAEAKEQFSLLAGL